jgi:hypothetical protein
LAQQQPLEIAGAAHLALAPGVVLLHPEEAVLEAMLRGWATQQQSRALAATTIDHGQTFSPLFARPPRAAAAHPRSDRPAGETAEQASQAAATT